MATGGVSSGLLSSTIGSSAESIVDGPGRLLFRVVTDGPLGTSSPVTLESTKLSRFWLNGVLLFETSLRFSSTKPSHEFRFSDEYEEVEPDDF